MMKAINRCGYIGVSGYGWSGSGACIDLLKEFEGFGALPGEFRISKDPHGLLDLENALVTNWDIVRHDTAIRDFLHYCNFLSRKSGLFLKPGGNFSNKLNVDLVKESELYIESLSDMTYIGDTFVHRYNISAYKNIIAKVKSKIGTKNARKMHLSRPDKGMFLLETKKYINNLFYHYANINNISNIVLDQAISPMNIINTSKFFEGIKVIIVDRDPRDIYVDMVKHEKLLGSELVNKYSAEKYIKWHKQLRRVSINDANTGQHILKINFEDLIFNYDASIKNIMNFLGIIDMPSKKGMYFSPNYSARNVGLWKNFKDQEVVNKIEKELEEYCYHER
jgi:hypothetical protein